MKVLAIDSTSQTSSVALSLNGREYQINSCRERAHADQILPMVDQLLTQHQTTLAQLDGFAFGRGPGGFTGLRMAAAVVQGLAYSVNKPVAAISSLAALAQQCIGETSSDTAILVCTDARKNQVYTASYVRDTQGLAQLTGQEQVLSPDQVRPCQSSMIGIGDGYAEYPQLQAHVERVVSGVSEARWIARLAVSGWAAFESPFQAFPVYIRDKVTQ